MPAIRNKKKNYFRISGKNSGASPSLRVETTKKKFLRNVLKQMAINVSTFIWLLWFFWWPKN